MTGLERALRIQPDERRPVAWIVAFFAVVQASHGVAFNTADALFFQRFGVERLPLMILVSGPAVMTFIIAHGAGLAAVDTARWLRRLMLACASWAGLEWVAAAMSWRFGYPVIWVSTQVIIMLTFTAMWNTAGAASTTRQAKRLFPLFATAGIAGGVLGNLMTGPLANLLGTANLLLVQSGLLLIGLGFLVPVAQFFSGDEVPDRGSVIQHISAMFETVRSSRVLRLASLVAAAMSCLFYLVYFPFSTQVASSFSNEARTAAFLGVFASIATAATFLVSLFATNRLFARVGIVVSLLLVPLVYAGGFVAWLALFSLTSAVIVRGLQWVSINAVGGTAFTALFNVVPGRRRGQIVAFMTAVPTQIGTIIGGALLMATTSTPRWVVFVVGLVVALIALVSVLGIRSAYVDALVTTVRTGMPGVFDVAQEGLFTPTDADLVGVLADHLHDPRPEARALAISWLSSLRGGSSAEEVEPLLDDTNPRVRVAAFDSMCSIDPGRISQHAATAVSDAVPEIRLHALEYLQRNPEAGHRSVGRAALSDDDPRVRAAAAVLIGGEDGQSVIDSLLADDDPRSIAAALVETTRPGSEVTVDPAPFLVSDSAPVRTAAVRGVAARDGEVPLLTPLLDDRSPRVRKAAATALAGTADGRSELQSVLERGSVIASEAALRALTPLEMPDESFLVWARGEAGRAAFLAENADSLEELPSSEACSYLVRVLRMRSKRLVDWVLRAMTTRQTATVMPIVARGIRSGDVEIKAQALEALETLGARSVTSVLLPLLEDVTHAPSEPDDMLRRLQSDFDPWIRELARRVLEERSGDMPEWSKMTSIDPTSSLDRMDRILMLQRVRMFSELDPEDLDLIASSVVEKAYEAAARIYTQGETGDEMLLVVRGEVIVTVGSGRDERIIQTYGPGEPVGELSLLSDEPRSADVRAGQNGVVGLILSRADLLSVLEERPVVAMGMLGTLARRLIEQT
jgi:HEAT repeat protein